MSEDHDNDDYDREDLEHVENLLYANIHYNTGYDENQSTASNNGNNDDNTLTELDRSNGSAARRNAKRYWSTNTPNNRAASNFKPFHKEKQSGIYKTGKVTTKDVNESAPDDAKNNENRDGISNAPTTVTPKQFTPYISFLPFNDSTANEEQTQSPSPSPVASTSKQSEPKSTVLNTNNDLIRKNLTVTHINPFSKKGTIEQYKNLLSEDDSIVSVANKTLLNKKRLNPFNPLSRKAKKKKSDTKSVRKNREELKQLAANADVIDVDDADKDDDDVIILPTQKPPLICLDSSDDEESNATNVAEHAFTEPNAVSDNRRKMPRCSSPSSSIQSTDDFIAQNDQRTFGFDTFATLSDEDLCHVSETVENQLTHNKTSESTSSKRTPIPTNNDNAIFTPPKQMQKDKNKAKKSYEVGANSFTAVDVYESESSDMPDSIYAKGTSNKRKKLSDSDSSSVESITIPKSKRLRKRKKSSGSAKESDHKYSDESSSDLPEMDDDTDDDEDEVSNEISYLVRGEALGKVKNSNKKKSTKPNKNTNENRSENDFINKLSSIVRGQDESDNDELESTQETPTETIEARDIVETVLQRRTKKSKKNQTVEAETVAPENEKTNPWEVTDQVGETDDLNLGRIFTDINGESDQVVSDDAKSENTKSDSAQKTTPANESNENVTENETNQNEDDSEVSEFDLESGWNDEMRRFYNDSWGGETFSMRNIRARMQRGYLNWMITNKDKFPGSSYNRGRQYRCLNCQEKGHLAKNCPRPPAKKICHMCGVEGHLEPKCPNTICLSCGNKAQRYFRGCQNCSRERMLVCFGCNQKGHREIFCPDRWRRYHSTTTLDQPLVEEPRSSKNPPKRKYCCICATEGHYADTCKKSNDIRGRWPTKWNVHISSYRPLLFSKNQDQQMKPKYTILASDLNDYGFNFGNEVITTGNTFYNRFQRAVKLDTNLNKSTSSENDVLFVNETNLHSTNGPTIEIVDDADFEMSGLEDVSASEEFSENTQDDSFMTIDDVQDEEDKEAKEEHEVEELTVSNETENAQPKNDNTVVSAKKDVEIEILNDKIHTLEELREKMLLHKSNAVEEDESSDQNTTTESESTISERANDIVTTASILPDFISLTNDEPDKYKPTRSPSPISADSTTNANEKSDATIHLTQKHCKHLLSDSGHQFLRDSETQFNVSVRLEWRQFGNVLIVNGIASDQQNFHNVLKQFFNTIEVSKKSSSIVQLPKNRVTLINFVRNQLAILDSPTCNVSRLCDVHTIFHRIRATEKNPSKANVKKIGNLRKHLNMIIFGRYGLGDGKRHLFDLQECVRVISQETATNVSMEMRQRMSEHIDYIFSSNEHTNYADMIDQYTQLKRDKALPPLLLDRKLLGLKINVYHPSDANGSNNTRKNSYTNSPHSQTYDKGMESSTSSNSKSENNKTNNKSHSMLDIQINVSTPSTSYHQNETMHRSNSFSSNRDRPLDKWKY